MTTLWRACWMTIVALGLASCTVPRHMQVRTSDDPENVDRDVRFRTTYYFRVFDQCVPLTPATLSNAKISDPVFDPGAGGRPVVLSDSLYRFRMTGKAHPLTSRAHFESGTLKAYQIDPFGANIAFDSKQGRFYPVSQQDTIRAARSDEEARTKLAQIQRLLALRGTLSKLVTDDKLPKEKSTKKIDNLIAQAIESLGRSGGTQGLASSAALAMADVAHVKAYEFRKAIDEAVKRVRANEDVKKWETGRSAELAKLSIQLPLTPGWPSPAPPTAALPTAMPTEPLPALQADRQWYEAQLHAAQAYLTPIRKLAVWAGQIAEASTAAAKVRKQAYDDAVSALDTYQALSMKKQAALDACTAQSILYSEARANYQESIGATPSGQTEQCARSTPIGPGDRTKRKDANTVNQMARQYIAEKQKLDAAFEHHESTKTVLDEAIKQFIPTDTPDETSEAIRQLTLSKNSAKTANDQSQQLAAQDQETFTELKRQQDLVERGTQALAELAASVTLMSASLQPDASSATSAGASYAKDPACPKGLQRRRGFQILGPEGFRTFDQDERLIMAMSSSGKPLIGVMQELSARVLNQKAAESDRLLPLANERIRLLKAQRLVDQASVEPPTDIRTFIEQIMHEFQ